MKRINFKITDYIERDLEWEKKKCARLGVDFSCFKLKAASPSEIIKHVDDADILLVNMAKINTEVIAGLNKVQVILRHGIGYDNVDVDAATAHGIVFANEATAASIDVAEQAIMLMFATYRKINLQREILESAIGKKVYDFTRTYPIYRIEGKTLGIVGCGNIGSLVLKKMQSFGMKALVVADPFLSEQRMKDLNIQPLPLHEVLERSDIVTIHLPLTDETRGMFNLDLFRHMKKTAIIINTSRGPIIKTSDLVTALREGMIAGAGLDVLEYEPPKSDCELLKMKNVVLTPHHSWYSEEGGWDIRRMIMDDLKAFINGKLPKHVVNPEVLKSANLRIKLKE
ncbi:MAG: C-terminal binding protein [Candidatus Latescibacteria bacterium]|nr:C-terminal binding protein [Candidatus Latescibacterota bacterium]